MELELNALSGSYKIVIERGCATSSKGIEKHLLEYIKEKFSQKIYLITDENVDRQSIQGSDKSYSDTIVSVLEESGYRVYKKVIKPGESSKHISNIPVIYEDLVQKSISRSDLIIGMGGGVVGDLAGFISATYLRGVTYIQIPTSLLAQVDSSVGGKTAVDIDSGKNMVGAFYHPGLVLIDTYFLKTLPDSEFRSGMAEVIKYGMISDINLFCLIEEIANDHMDDRIFCYIDDIVYRSCSIKKSIVEEDEFDRGKRMILNFGHTIGHAIESYYDYKKYSHGQAVAIGMYEVTKLANSKGLVSVKVMDRLEKIIEEYGLEVHSPLGLSQIIRYIERDKKVVGGILNLIVADEIGHAKIIETKMYG